MSLKAKTVAAFSTFTFLISLTLALIAAHQLSSALEEQFLERGKELAERVAKEAFLYLFVIGEGNLDALVDSVVDRDVLYLQIVKEGVIVAQRGPSDFLPEVSPCPAGFSIQEHRTTDGIRYLDIKRSLLGRPAKGTVGEERYTSYVRLGFSLAAIGEKLRAEYLAIGLAAGGMVLLGISLAFLLYRTVLAPLEDVTKAIQQFGEGKFNSRADAIRDDEIGTLAREFNRMADAIVEMRDELQQASQAKSRFLTVMSHELRTPLHALMGYAELLLSGAAGELSGKQRHYLEAIQRAGEHLLELLENALLFSKLELGVEKLHPEKVDCREVLEEAVKACPLGKASPELQIHVPDEPIPMEADKTKLRQIFINLISNALRFAEEKVEVKLVSQADGILITVKDDGPGIAPEEQTRVFEPFVKSKSSRSREGLGLGLAIVKRYVEMHGGRVWVESTPGEGATFYVMFPLAGGGRDESPEDIGGGRRS